MLRDTSNPLSDLGGEIEEINKRLRMYESIWKNKEPDIIEQAQVLEEIATIEAQIQALHPTDLMNSDQIISH